MWRGSFLRLLHDALAPWSCAFSLTMDVLAVARAIVSNLFAEYLPRAPSDPRRLLPADRVVRPALPQDAAGLARIIAQREGRDYVQEYQRRVRELNAPPTPGRLLLVAIVAGDLIAFG